MRKACGIAACALIAFVVPVPAASQAQSPASPIADARAAQALQRGYWVVETGDHLYRIARHFATHEDEARRLANELRVLNEHALIANDPSKLVVGARVFLPKRMLGLPEDSVPPRPVAKSASPASPSARRAPPGAGAAPPVGVPPIAAGAPEPPPRRAPSTEPAGPAYEDRVLVSGDDRETGLDDRRRDDSPGLRQWAVELRSENRSLSTSGTTQADGLGLRYAMETERYGDFTVLGQVTSFRPPANDPRGDRTRATGTLLHENFALGNGLTANSALGVVRPLFPIWLTSSYRVSFSPSLLVGAQTAITSPVSDLRLGAGRMGQLAGLGIQQFERTTGEEAVASYTHRLGPEWSLGAAAIAVRDSDTIRRHTTATVGINRDLGLTGPGFKLQVASTDEGEKAAWFDSRMRTGRLVQRFGAYQVDPDFVFGESGATRDVRGAYWRGEYRAAGNFYSFGVEGTQDNLRRDPTRGGTDAIGGYGNATLRLDRTLQVGGGGSLRHEEPRVEGGVSRQVAYANAFASKSWAGGVSRLDANMTSSRPDGSPSETTRFIGWNQEWPSLRSLDFTTLVSQTDEDRADRPVRRRLANVHMRGPVYGTLRWDASLTYVDINDPRGGERNYNASLGLDWNPAPQWTFQLLWFRNRVQPGPDNPLSPFVKEDVVQLTARYEDSAGSPYPRIAGGRSGTGRIVGSVFYDENGDGVRQANERGAPGVQVVLDDRQAAVTDNDGRFQFALVPAGTHRLRPLVERVPLPWGLQDDAAREVRLDVRGDVRIDIGLTRIAP